MALPQTFDPSEPADSDSPAEGAAHLRDHVQKFIDLFGIPPAPAAITAPLAKVNADGSWAPPLRLTNASGVAVVAGDVCALSNATTLSVILGDVSGSLRRFAVAQESIANAATGLWTGVGITSVRSQGVITLGHYVKKSATTLAVEDTTVAMADATAPPSNALGLAVSNSAAGYTTVLWWGAVAGSGGDQAANATVGDLRIEEATLPDGTGATNAPPEIVREVSSTQLANTPKVTRTYARFDDTAEENLMWSLLCPSNYLSGGTLRVKWKSVTVIGNSCVWKAGVCFSTDGSSVDSALSFNAADVVISPVAGVVGTLKEATITLTMTGAAANRWMTIFLGRDTSHASDLLVGDAWLAGARFEYVGS